MRVLKPTERSKEIYAGIVGIDRDSEVLSKLGSITIDYNNSIAEVGGSPIGLKVSLRGRG